jgi:outer membrane protein TolC
MFPHIPGATARGAALAAAPALFCALFAATFGAVLAVAPLPARANAAPLTFDAALALAEQRSATAQAARAGLTSARESAVAADRFTDPVLRLGIENLPAAGADRYSTARDPQTMKRVGISQEWLSGDKRTARRAAAERTVAREALQLRIAVADARLQAAQAYADAWYTAEALQLSALTEGSVREELEAARARLAGAAGGIVDVLALTAMRGMVEDEAAEGRQQQRAAALALQRWVGLPEAELAPLPVLPVPTAAAFVEGHPAVRALQGDADVARQAAAVAATERSPNWMWEVSVGQRTGYPDMLSVGVSIPLPVAREQRQDRETAAKQALVEKTEAEQAEATRAATAEFLTLASDAERLQARMARVRLSVLQPAQQRSAAALAAYRANQAPLASVFEARRAEIDAQRKLLGLQRELTRNRIQLALKPVDAATTLIGSAP